MQPFLATVSAARIARPTSDLDGITSFYVATLGFDHLGGFVDHDGYDGCFVAVTGASWHMEFTQNVDHVPSPTVEDLLVLYMPRSSVLGLSAQLKSAGHSDFEHPNPYWAEVGAQIFIDPDGYPIVLCPNE